MNQTPEQKARDRIDAMLKKSGWHVCDYQDANIHAHKGVALRHFQLKPGHGEADYLFYVEGKAAGVIEAKKIGSTLAGVEIQSNKYKNGLPEGLPAWHRPLPFAYDLPVKKRNLPMDWTQTHGPAMSSPSIDLKPWLSG